MSIVVTARFAPSPGRREELIAVLTKATAEVHGETGCELYALHQAADGSVWFIEKWTTEEALNAHGAGKAVRSLSRGIAELIESAPVVTRMLSVPAGSAAQGVL